MSFTAEVKDELARVTGACSVCEFAELSAMLRICGSLSLKGNGRYSVRVSTETGAVARTVLSYVHRLLDLETALTVRRSELHRSRNYLIEIHEDPRLDEALVQLGILRAAQGLNFDIPYQLLKTDHCKAAFVRGAFLAGGFIADPRGDFHLEIALTGESYAQGLIEIMRDLGVSAGLNHRRGSCALYLKSYEGVHKLLHIMGASTAGRAVEQARRLKMVKNEVNRRVNAEYANEIRSSDAAAAQRLVVQSVEKEIGFKNLPLALREFCTLRLRYPEVSLGVLGQHCTPQASKSAMYHRYLRLSALLTEAREANAHTSS